MNPPASPERKVVGAQRASRTRKPHRTWVPVPKGGREGDRESQAEARVVRRPIGPNKPELNSGACPEDLPNNVPSGQKNYEYIFNYR